MSKLQGEVEVRLEERDGTLVKSVRQHNFITNIGKQTALSKSLSGITGLNTLLGKAAAMTLAYGTNIQSETMPTTMGIYAMNSDLTITPDVVFPPYVQDDLVTLSPNVKFYTTGSAFTTETDVGMQLYRSYISPDGAEYTVDYIKNSGTGTVKSLCIGRIHSEMAATFQTFASDVNRNLTWQAATPTIAYFFEHKADKSFIWKNLGNTAVYKFDLTDKTSPIVRTATATWGGVAAGGGLAFTAGDVGSETVVGIRFTAPVVQAAQTRVNLPIIASIAANFFVNNTVTALATIAFTLPQDDIDDGTTLIPNVTGYHPVMLLGKDSTDTNPVIEIFQTVGIGPDGFKVMRAVLTNVLDPTNIVVAVDEETYTFPVAIGNYYNSSFEASDVPGYYDAKEGDTADPVYYLPYTYVWQNNAAKLVANNQFCPGIEVSDDLSEVGRRFIYRTALAFPGVMPFAKIEGKVRQVCPVAAAANQGWVYPTNTQVFSAIQLPEPVEKTADKTLHIIYKYRLVD
jgi:hypothetical protein